MLKEKGEEIILFCVLMSPFTSKAVEGLVVPMPTLPLLSIRILSVGVDVLLVVVKKDIAEPVIPEDQFCVVKNFIDGPAELLADASYCPKVSIVPSFSPNNIADLDARVPLLFVKEIRG